MKLLSVGLARSLWFIDLSELNPGGKDIFTEVVPTLIEDYKFKVYPKPDGDFKEGMKFTNGVFTNRKGDTLGGATLTVWTDGIAADTYSSTKDSDEFLEEALGILPEIGFVYDPAMVRRKAYLSQLNVRCSKDLNILNPKLADFAGKISSVAQIPFGISAIEFWPDQTQLLKPANFSFQKKIGEPPSGDRYWSQAGMPTDKHVELLEELEAILS
jgi:hypothetical protein